MAKLTRAVISFNYTDGRLITAQVGCEANYPDAIRQVRLECVGLLNEALDHIALMDLTEKLSNASDTTDR